MSRVPIQTNAADDVELATADAVAGHVAREEARQDRVQLASYEGRQFVWRRLERCGVFQEIVGDADQVQRALGRRSEGLELLARAMAHPDLFMQMWQEALKRRGAQRELVEAVRQEQRKKQPKAA